jgi:16S rRNA (cytosine1402-N4)-methyltransferase
LANEKKVSILTKKPLVPTPEELSENRRSKSAKLRVAERIS